MGGPNSDRNLESLGLTEVIQAVVHRARTPGGKRIAGDAALAPDRATAEARLDETEAAVHLLDRRPDFDIEPCEDITGLILKAKKGAALGGAELLLFAPVLTTGTKLNVVLSDDTLDGIEPIRVHPPEVPGLAELLTESLDEQGQVRRDATPRIEELYRSLHSLRQTIQAKAEKLLTDTQIAPALQDEYVTLRDNRYVLPIVAEKQSHVEGIIHDSSNSGQTFFIEPKALVELNNRLRTLEMELADEVAKLLHDLSVMVADEADAIEEIYRTICRLDAIVARARLAADLGGTRLGFTDRVALKSAAHAVMLLENKEVVRNSIAMPEEAKALIISGPNTGGKTVALSIVGLAAAMARMGLFVPAGEGSGIPFYENIFADIGDSQSIADDLSTFSGHLMIINRIVRGAGPGSLALLDELMINTDPKEGSALAMAVVEKLVAQGADVVATTHFHELKVVAQTLPGYHNVSMEFDVLDARPTYFMIEGTPGESSALAVAERLELDASIVAAARGRLEGTDERVERTLAALREQTGLLKKARREAEAHRAETERVRREIETIRGDMEQKRAGLAKTAKRKLSGEIATARRAINELIEQARAGKGSPEVVKSVRGKLDAIAAEARMAGAPEENIPRDQLREGDEVYIVPLQARGLLASDPKGGKADVSMGSIRMTVHLDDVVGARRTGRAPEKDKQTVTYETPPDRHSGAEAELNIIGLRADEAIEKVEKFLDTMFSGPAESCRIIHGKGTGTLRAAVRDYLATSPYIDDFFTAEPEKGGDGATVVLLRRG